MENNISKKFQNIGFISFSLILFTGIVVCSICDVAIFGKFTWSLIPICSSIFTWFVLFPVIKLGRRGILITLIILSLMVIPYIYVLDFLIETDHLLFKIGFRVSIIGIIYLWVIFSVFCLLRKKKLFAVSVSLFLSIPTYILVNNEIGKIISENFLGIWDILSFIIIGAISLLTAFLACIITKQQNPKIN